MRKKLLYDYLIDYFSREMPEVETELRYGNNFQLLVAVILSAQCTDKRVNMVTPALFKAYPNAEAMAKATTDDLLHFIHSVSYPNSKAEHLLGAAKIVAEEYGGEVPSDMDMLLRLPGVGRKTANVVQAVAFGKAAMAVDTHIFRVSHRIGLASKRQTTPYSVEKELASHFPPEIIPKAHHWLLLHGRYVCTARNPKCAKCGISEVCKKIL